MSVADKLRKREMAKHTQTERETGESRTGTPSTTLVAIEPAHITRIKGVVRFLEHLIKNSDESKSMSRMAFFMTTATDELAEEMRDMDEMQIRLYMFRIGEVISWIGHGDNSRLPEELRQLAEMISPTRGGDDDNSTDDNGKRSPIAIGPATR